MGNPAVLLRESYREGDQVKKRTLANLSKLPDDIIDNLKLALKGATLSMTEGIPNHFEVMCRIGTPTFAQPAAARGAAVHIIR